MGLETDMKLTAALLLIAVVGGTASPAAASTARCIVKTADASYAGPCRFSKDRGGSFNIAPLGRTEFFKHARQDPGVTDIRVDVDRGEADVHGLTTSGINSRWGEAKRSKLDRACWIGDDFSLCIY
jgi:hypothetical protein